MEKNFEYYADKYPKGAIHLVVPGHGGLDENGVYQIIKKGQKQAMVDGEMIYEGHLNRKLVSEIIKQRPKNSSIANLIPETDDIPRPERIARINKISDAFYKDGFFPILWEIHLNGFNGKASGTEIYTTRGNNLSDTIATMWWNNAQHIVGGKYPNYKWRPDTSDGDIDKEKDFDIIKKSKAFGVLIEFYFFDHPESIKMFNNPFGHSLWANTVIETIKEIDNYWKV